MRRGAAVAIEIVAFGPGIELLKPDNPAVADGARVVIHAKPDFWVNRGSFSLAAVEVRAVGLGELLARLEHLKRVLSAEGLFRPERKRPLPFLPHRVGLICGRDSAAERDVLENARRRWPAVRFTVEPVAVQGSYAVTEVMAALDRLDGDPEIDVIIISRGGGSLEDLLPFSDEALVRAVAACRTPIVTASPSLSSADGAANGHCGEGLDSEFRCAEVGVGSGFSRGAIIARRRAKSG